MMARDEKDMHLQQELLSELLSISKPKHLDTNSFICTAAADRKQHAAA
jgi:hypothetical protein